MKRWIKHNSLSIVMLGLFFGIVIGQSFVGMRHFNDDQQEHNQPAVGYVEYIKSGDFIESVFENWESEFLQMGSFVILTVYLRQKGSPESKKLEGSEAEDAEPKHTANKNSPWPVRQGGVVLKIYEHSLSLAFLLLFLVSFWLHAYGGARATCQENLVHKETKCESTIQYVGTSKFWFESLQNWQSEFLAVGSIVYLAVYLREKGSPESKPVSTPHHEHGSQ
jgi:hypothetical protein